MPRSSPYVITLTKAEREELAARARKYTSPYRDVIRAKIVLLAFQGLANEAIASRLDTPRQIVSKWRKRFSLRASRASRKRREGGAPPAFPPSVVVEVKALACELPARRALPLARWSLAELRREVMAHGVVAQISGATLWRWLSQAALRPWRHRSWIFPRDPAFAAKTGRILDLYEGRWQGRRLGPREDVLCADEQTSIQARRRIHSTQPPAPGRAMRVEHEYVRRGAWAFLAAWWDVRRARLLGRCERTTGIAPFEPLVAPVMRQDPCRSARRLFWVVDNDSSHRGERAAARLQARWPTLVLVHTPVHASWLTHVEISFSLVQRNVLTPNDFASLAAVTDRLLRFPVRSTHLAKPFQWTFTRRDLAAVLAKLARPRPAAA
ncbi:MAG: IS630 family transposase [Candidatus Rokubacteria bacterium]|nr:IS630 family transposase [Candidatus Rokubacteria bacterium]